MARRIHCSFFAVALFAVDVGVTDAQNLRLPTLGGNQLWTDHFIYGDWRIQEQALTGHFRLLDDTDDRRAWGSYDHCRREFDRLKREEQLPRLGKTAVVTLHGLGRTRDSMQELADFLAEQGEWTSINVSYASTRRSIADHARALKRVLDSLAGVDQVHLVGHSLGNIIIRHYLADRQSEPEARAAAPRIGRVVMLAPPNNGSALARLLDNQLFEWIAGASGLALGSSWEALEPHLATPRDFGVIAGSTLGGNGTNPLIPGDDDVIVGVEETHLAGAGDFLVVKASHTFIMNKEEVQTAVLRFLQAGYFTSPEQRTPLPHDTTDQEKN